MMLVMQIVTNMYMRAKLLGATTWLCKDTFNLLARSCYKVPTYSYIPPGTFFYLGARRKIDAIASISELRLRTM